MMVHHGMIFAALIIYLPPRYHRHQPTGCLELGQIFSDSAGGILYSVFSPERRHNGREWSTVADQMTEFVTNIHENSSSSLTEEKLAHFTQFSSNRKN